jgi:glycine/D-amino acid oxidase-like deaminating enzyme
MRSPQPIADFDFDTVVIGGGIVGLCVSWFLAQDGAAVACIDDGRDAGSTANAGSLHVQMQSRLLRLFPERLEDYQTTLPIYPRAVDYWHAIADGLGDDIELRTSGGLMIADNPTQMAALERKNGIERKKGVESDIIGRQELLRMAPYLNSNVQGAAYCAKEGKLNPLLANTAIRRKAQQSGAHVRSRSKATRIDVEPRGYRVTTATRVFHAARVVIAAGAGSGEIAATLGLHLPITAEPLHMNITEPAEPFMHNLLQHAELPITLKQLLNGQVLIGGGWPARQSAAGAQPEVLRESLTGNLQLAQQMVPRLGPLSVVRCWAGINPMVDLLSVIGEIDGLPGLFVAIPGDAGYTLGPYCARLLVDAMQGRSTDFPLSLFAPDRFASRNALA